MCPSLIQIGSKTAAKNSAQTDKKTNRQTDTTKIMVAVNQNKERNLPWQIWYLPTHTLSNWSQVLHGYGVLWRIFLMQSFIKNFEDVEGRNLHSHITLAVGLYVISGLVYISLQMHTMVGRNWIFSERERSRSLCAVTRPSVCRLYGCRL